MSKTFNVSSSLPSFKGIRSTIPVIDENQLSIGNYEYDPELDSRTNNDEISITFHTKGGSNITVPVNGKVTIKETIAAHKWFCTSATLIKNGQILAHRNFNN